jgi:hypothetical protein
MTLHAGVRHTLDLRSQLLAILVKALGVRPNFQFQRFNGIAEFV